MSNLEWHEQRASTPHYVAFTQRGCYDIAFTGEDPRNPRWYTNRMSHPLMPPFDGFCPDLEAAKRACENDYIALQRADRWLDYMRDNEPSAAQVDA